MTVLLERPDKTHEEVSLDRVELDTPPLVVSSEPQEIAVSSDVSESKGEFPKIFVVERLVKHKQYPDAPEEHFLWAPTKYNRQLPQTLQAALAS